MMIRQPSRAGLFYPASEADCRRELDACLPSPDELDDLPDKLFGGIVPHAGWRFSGDVALKTFAAIATRTRPATIVIFGAAHRRTRSVATLFAHGAWQTPLGEVAIDERFAERLLGASNAVADEPFAHEAEHSIEVQVPFMQHFFPNAKLVPIMMMPHPQAVDIGTAAARIAADSDTLTVVIGSTDLTHYGPNYGMTEHGIGPEGLRWAKSENDRRMIDRILAMDAIGVIDEAGAHHNACGAGAIAACITACQQAGATTAKLLEHTTSAEVAAGTAYASKTDAVGYASIVFGA
jgi:AmmeMemoRadiSam system protein B